MRCFKIGLFKNAENLDILLKIERTHDGYNSEGNTLKI